MKLEALCASLGAYAETRPVLDTLRLCHRFGRGPKCVINKLPVELVQQIEDYIAAPALPKHQDLWAPALRCLEEVCNSMDHLDKEFLIMHYLLYNPAPASRDPSDEALSKFYESHEADDFGDTSISRATGEPKSKPISIHTVHCCEALSD